MKPSTAELVGKIYSDKSFSIGLKPREKKKQLDKQYDKAYSEQFDSYSEVKSLGFGQCERVTHKFQIPLQAENRFIKSQESSQKSQKKAKRYGGKGITQYGRKSVTNIALLLQKKYGRKRIGFGTATLPDIPKEMLTVIHENWGNVVRRFFQSIKRFLKKAAREFVYCGVTEVQEKRYKKTGVFALHLHWVYLSKGNSKDFWISANELRRLWRKTLIDIFKLNDIRLNLSIDDFKASIDCQVVKKSCSAYLGKYLSKGAKVIENLDESVRNQLPGQWWFACMQSKKMFKESIIRMDTKLCESIFYGLEHYLHEGTIVFAKFIKIEIKEKLGQYYTVGVVGRFSASAYDLLK